MITFEPLAPGSVPAVVDLFRREKGTVRAHQLPQHLTWAFFDQPLAQPDRPVVEVACEEGRVLGVMGAIPQTILWGEAQIDAAFFVDWLVDRTQRRRQIGSQLIRRAAARYPVAVHMGSTPAGYATCATLGARDCGATATARRILDPHAWAAGSARGNGLTRLLWRGAQTVRSLFRSPQAPVAATATPVSPMAIDDALRANAYALAQTHICTLRFGARWQWLLDSPLYAGNAIRVDTSGGVAGYALLIAGYRSGRLVGSVADISVASVAAAPIVLKTAVRALAAAGVAGITCTLSTSVVSTLVAGEGFSTLARPRMGTWLAPGHDGILDRPWFMTMAENLSVAAGIDVPVRLPLLRGLT